MPKDNRTVTDELFYHELTLLSGLLSNSDIDALDHECLKKGGLERLGDLGHEFDRCAKSLEVM